MSSEYVPEWIRDTLDKMKTRKKVVVADPDSLPWGDATLEEVEKLKKERVLLAQKNGVKIWKTDGGIFQESGTGFTRIITEEEARKIESEWPKA